MKKIILLVTMLILAGMITACGSSPKVYAGFYSANIPEGFNVNEEENEFRKDSEAHPGYEEIIKVYVSYGDAEQEITRSIDYWKDNSSPHQRIEDVTYGDITWKVETFTWNDGVPSCTFYTNTEDGNYIEVTCFLLAHDSEEVVSMMESFTFEEGAYDKNREFVDSLYE